MDSTGNVFVTGVSATINYSSSGVTLWTRRYDGPAKAIVADSAGNVFVTGGSSIGSSATIAYSNAGVPLWTNRYNGDLSKIAVDRNGNVFVTGQSTGTNGTYNIGTIKYSSSVPPPRLDFQTLNNQLVLSWTNAGFNLQSAPTLTGPFTNLPVATSPYTNPLTAPQQFFRLIGN